MFYLFPSNRHYNYVIGCMVVLFSEQKRYFLKNVMVTMTIAQVTTNVKQLLMLVIRSCQKYIYG